MNFSKPIKLILIRFNIFENNKIYQYCLVTTSYEIYVIFKILELFISNYRIMNY